MREKAEKALNNSLKRAGLDDPRGSFPSRNILGFCDLERA